MSYALPTGLAQQAREATPPPPDPVVQPAPGVISSALAGTDAGFPSPPSPSPFSIPGFGQSYDEGYQPASGGIATQSAQSPSVAINGDPILGALTQASNASNAGIRDITSSVLPRFGIDTSQLPWYERDPLNMATAPFSVVGGLGGIVGGAGAGLTSGAANQYLPQDMNPFLRQSLVTLASIPGALAGGKLGGVADAVVHPELAHAAGPTEPPADPFPELTPEEAAKTQADLIQQQRDAQYGGQAAGQVGRTGQPSPDALRQPDYGQTAEEVVSGNKAALERATGSTIPLDPTSPYYDPKTDLMLRIEDAKPLQEQNAELLSQFRSRQAGAFNGAIESGPGGREGAMQALGAMRGAAERVSFQPLRDALAPGAEDTLFDTITSSNLRPFEKANAYSALDDILSGQVPTPYDTAQLEKAFPGVTAALQRSKIMGPSHMVKEALTNPLSTFNNAVRASNTVGDVAWLSRYGLGPALADPEAFMAAAKPTFRSYLGDTTAVAKAAASIDDKAIANGLPTLDEWAKDYGLKVGTLSNPDAATGGLADAAGKIPGVGGALKGVLTGFRSVSELYKAQLANDEVLLRRAAGENVDLAEVAKGSNVVGLSSNLRIPEEYNLLLRFPNIAAARYELLGRSIAAIPNPTVANQMALKAVSRIIMTGLGLTAAINAVSQAEAALHGKPAPKQEFKYGIPLATLPDVLTSALRMPKGTHWDAFLGLGETTANTIGVGVKGVQGGIAGAANGPVGAVEGAAKGAGSALWNLYDSLASPLEHIALGLYKGEDSYGQPTRNLKWLGGEVAPFVSDTFLGTDTRSTATKALGSLGVSGIHEPSARDQFAQSLGKQSWADLEPSQRTAFENQMPSVTQQQVGDLTKTQHDRVTAAAQQMTNGQLTPQAFRNVLHDAEGTLYAQKQVVYQNAGTKPGADKVLDPYFKMLDSVTDPVTGKPDYDLVDEYRAKLSPEDNAYIDRNTGLTFKDIPAVAQYKADAKAISDSGYWNLADALAADFGQQLGYKGVKNQGDLVQQLAEEAKQTYGNDPLATSKFIDRVMGKYNAQLGKEHLAFLADRPQIVPMLNRWGYGMPTKALGLLPQ